MAAEDHSPENAKEKEWLQKEYANVLSYCSRNAMRVSNIIQQESAILPPIVAVWLVEIQENAQQIWVITGDIPYDHITSKCAKNAREALNLESSVDRL
ncbi:MAG: DUF4826 family protein [Gammaproteobacteria bacterium]|nr:DUF4826 family protein [Gammaproteobacteria bacterium]